MRHYRVVPTLLVLACGGGNPENSPVCGFSSIAAATMIKAQMSNMAAALTQLPKQLPDTLLGRVTGHGSGWVTKAAADSTILQYKGDGFPQIPGFGLMLVDDSSEVVRGVLVYDVDPPVGYPLIGGVTNGRLMLPLHGLRVRWSVVNDAKCPLFSQPDTTRT